jgi:hypothetical protein
VQILTPEALRASAVGSLSPDKPRLSTAAEQRGALRGERGEGGRQEGGKQGQGLVRPRPNTVQVNDEEVPVSPEALHRALVEGVGYVHWGYAPTGLRRKSKQGASKGVPGTILPTLLYFDEKGRVDGLGLPAPLVSRTGAACVGVVTRGQVVVPRSCTSLSSIAVRSAGESDRDDVSKGSKPARRSATTLEAALLKFEKSKGAHVVAEGLGAGDSKGGDASSNMSCRSVGGHGITSAAAGAVVEQV